MAPRGARGQNEGNREVGVAGFDAGQRDIPERESGSALVREHLFAARSVLIFGEVTSALAESVCGQLLALAERSDAPIRVVVHSPGGHVESADTIHDVIRCIGPQVLMLGTGWVASAGALIYAGAARERRFALPNTRFLLHQPLGGVGGPASDVEIEARQIVAMRQRLNGIFADATGQTVEKIASDTERNHWLSAREAVAYGLVGSIVESADALKALR
jgi:ATP-dependent Clp protease protease subunit